MSIRCFAAVELSSNIRKTLAAIRAATEKAVSLDPRAVKWIGTDQMHLTLKFLGEIDDDMVPPICQALQTTLTGVEPFDIELNGLGFFPSRGPARVLWAGLKTGADALCQLQQKVEQALAHLDFPPEGRDWSPHLTLARISMTRTGNAIRQIPADLFQKSCPKPLIQTVNSVIVFESELTRQGPIYTPLHQTRLG